MKMKYYILAAGVFALAACESQKQSRPEYSSELSLNKDISNEISVIKWKKTKITKGSILDLQETPNGDLMAATPDGLLLSKDDGITWQELYDKAVVSKQINCISSDGKYVYISVDVKGVFRSKDNGISWEQSSKGLKSAPFAIRDLQHIEGKIYAGTSDGIYVSSDSAITWTESNKGVPMAPIIEEQPPHHVNIYSIIPGKSNLFAISDKGILSSDLEGSQWNLTNTENANPEITSAMLSTSDEIYAAKYLKDGIYKSTNNGLSWESVGLKGYNLHKIHISSNGVLYAGTHQNGIYRSTNKGISWHELNKGLPKKAVVNSIISTKTGTILIGVENNGIYRLAN